MTVLFMLAGCGAPGGLRPGISSAGEVRAAMGPPAREWRDGDGSLQWAYPQGPMGMKTFMARFGPDGRLLALENVLDTEHFARIQPGVSDQAFVSRLLGPPFKVTDFDRRNEQAWDWRYRDVWTARARFTVIFDRATGVVKERFEFPELRWEAKE